MKSKYPNASILSIITQSIDNEEEKLAFLYAKPVPDFYSSDKVYWYEGKGKDGKASVIWPKLSIKQLVACGRDSDIDRLFENVIGPHSIKINGKPLLIKVPTLTRNEQPGFTTLKIEDKSTMPKEFYQKENLRILSGFQLGAGDIKPIFPLGLFDEEFLYSNLMEGVIGIKENRVPSIIFHGHKINSQKNVGSNELVGFYQENFDAESTYSVLVKNEADLEIGRSEIAPDTGLFDVHLKEPTISGTVIIMENGKEKISKSYTLLQEIDISVNVIEKALQDAYGKLNYITNEQLKPHSFNPNFTWQRDVYANVNEADSKLSERFKLLFEYLGPDVLIADPYYINSVSQDPTTKKYSLKHCQIAFINALFHSIVEGSVKTISILGSNSRANNHFDKDESLESTTTMQRFENYEAMFRGYINSSKLQGYFPNSTITFKNSPKDFHNRYWFSIKYKNEIPYLEKCVILTNSIGNIYEVDFVEIIEPAQKNQIVRKYRELFTLSDTELRI